MKIYKLLNNVFGWVVFAIAATVYLLTIEPTASFWDCGEFIASAYKLEVGHPPGNPIFMLTANLFTQLTSDVSLKATMVNAMSAICSAFTILFLFWTITHLARKILLKESEEKSDSVSLSKIIGILGCGAVGALVYTFSDTFWFSAVEAEVYAYSSLLTAFVFWLILKWEDVADEPHADRWLILIAYIVGVSIAVHLLNLLCIPAIVLVYYFKKYPNPNLKGTVIALLFSFVLLAIVLFGIIQGLMKVAGWFELLFVNIFKLPYNSGVAFYVVLFVGIVIWGIWETMREKHSMLRSKIAFILAVGLLGIPFLGNNPLIGIMILTIFAIALFIIKKVNLVSLNTILIGLFVIFIGYSSYALIMIRSSSNPPMDQNSPEDIFTLRTYLGREQYGDTPLLYGQTFVSERKIEGNGYALKDQGPIWMQIAKHDQSEKDRYFIVGRKNKPIYVDELNTLFPRMFSNDDRHIEGYKYWTNITDKNSKRVRINTPRGPKIVNKPTFLHNISYFFNYQVNYMYWRYFMWNFSGRQNDIQGHGGITNGNWITGIKFLDALRLGPQDDLPDSIAKNNGHNKFYMLPLLLGLIGIFFQIYSGKKGIQGFWITFFLFFMLGLAIVVYLNQKPFEPRERDYAYAGSFYAFSIWIGLGVAGVIYALTKFAKIKELPAAIAGSALCLIVPVQMLSQTWDDHDRSKRYVSRDFGYNYLTTCEPNAIIFTMGDNDTFPLWYNQEVEGFRTDVRVCNLSYLQTDWYIDQMKRQAYESEPLPISWKKTDYITGTHEYAYVLESENPMQVSRALEWVKSDDLRTKRIPQWGGVEADNIPTELLYIPIDSMAVVNSGIVNPKLHDKIEKQLLINLGNRLDSQGRVVEQGKGGLVKKDMIILDMISNNKDWSRPIYFAITVDNKEYLRLNNYFRQDGLAYRLVPYKTEREYIESDSLVIPGRNLEVDTDILYENMMHKYRWGNLEEPGVYLDENAMRMAKTFRSLFANLAENLLFEEKIEKAKEVLDYSLKVLPEYNVPYDISIYETARLYQVMGENDKAKEIFDVLVESYLKNLNWYHRLSDRLYAANSEQILRDLRLVNEFLRHYSQLSPEAYEAEVTDYNIYMQRYQHFIGSRQLRQMGGTNE